MPYGKRAWHKRAYVLNDAPIASSRVRGMLHTATKDLGRCMANCGRRVVRGQRYVMLGIIGASPIHLGCMGENRMILGVGVRERSRYGLPRRAVVCAEYERAGERFRRVPPQMRRSG